MAVPSMPSTGWCGAAACWVRGVLQAGWVVRVGIPGEYYPAIPRAEEQTHTSEAGPGRLLQGAWSGWVWGWDDPFVRPTSWTTTPCGRARFAVQEVSPGK